MKTETKPKVNESILLSEAIYKRECEYHVAWINTYGQGINPEAVPDMLDLCNLILARLDVEANEKSGMPFVCAAYREDLRKAIAKAKEVEK